MLTGPQRRVLREIAEGRVAQDRVARIYLDGDGPQHRVREPRLKSYQCVLYSSLARHRKAAVRTKASLLPIDLTDAGREALDA